MYVVLINTTCIENNYFKKHFRPLDKEYWEGEDLYYDCIDTSLGADANSSNFKKYKCIADKPTGRYNTPRDEHSHEEWPICQPKTTTVKPGK